MLKNIIRLLTAVMSFLLFLVLPNTTSAATQSVVDNQPVIERTNLVNLNTVGSSLLSQPLAENTLLHLGCTCVACTQANKTVQS